MLADRSRLAAPGTTGVWRHEKDITMTTTTTRTINLGSDESLHTSAAMLGDDDRATFIVASRIRELLAASDLPPVVALLTANHSGRLAIEIEAPLVGDELWVAGLRFRWSRSHSLEVLIDDLYSDSLPSPDDAEDVTDFLRAVVRDLVRDYHASRRRYCTGSLDEDDQLRHYDADGACPIHPGAELLP